MGAFEESPGRWDPGKAMPVKGVPERQGESLAAVGEIAGCRIGKLLFVVSKTCINKRAV